jgi:hypothetical protein
VSVAFFQEALEHLSLRKKLRVLAQFGDGFVEAG